MAIREVWCLPRSAGHQEDQTVALVMLALALVMLALVMLAMALVMLARRVLQALALRVLL